MIADGFSGCSSPALGAILSMIKRAINIIQIIVPILLMISLIFTFIKLMNDPDNKKLLPRIKNAALATVIVFMIPVFVNVVMSMLGENFSVSACWNSIHHTSSRPTYINPYGDKQNQMIINNPDDYEKGNPRKQGTPLDVKSGFTKYSTGKLDYYVYLPPEATTNMPMIVWLHGDNPRVEWTLNNRIGETAYKAGVPVIMVEPFAGTDFGSRSNPGWYEGGLIPEVKKIADIVCEAYQCDTENINIGGHSRGAIGTWMTVSAYPNYFHAAAPISCCSFYGMKASSFSGMKVWAWRGSGAGTGDNNDDIYACMQGDVNAVKAYAKEVRYTIQPNTTHGDATDKPAHSEEFVKFMFEK